MVVGAAPSSLHIGPSLLSCSLPPSCSREQSTHPERERESGQSALQIGRYGLGKKGSAAPLLHSPPLVIVQREDGGRFAESPVAPVHRRKICRSIKREKLGGFVAPRRGVSAEQVLKLLRMARIVACVWWNIVLRCIVSEVLENGLSLLSRHSRHPYPSIPLPSSTLHNTPSISLTPLLSSPLLSSVVVAVAVVATHFIHFKCYDERRGSGTCSPPPSARRSIVLATMKHSERRKQ